MLHYFSHFDMITRLRVIRVAKSVIYFSVVIFLACCNNDDDQIPTPQLGEYVNFEDCPIDAEGELNGYGFSGSALARVRAEYPEDHFSMSTSNFRNFGAQTFFLLIYGKYDSLSLRKKTDVHPIDSIRLPFSELGETAVIAFMDFEGGIAISSTRISYRLDECPAGNLFVLDSVSFVDGDPQKRGGMWYGRFDLKFFKENTPENIEGADYASSVGIQVPETLHYQDISFSAPTRVNHLDFDCGR